MELKKDLKTNRLSAMDILRNSIPNTDSNLLEEMKEVRMKNRERIVLKKVFNGIGTLKKR